MARYIVYVYSRLRGETVPYAGAGSLEEALRLVAELLRGGAGLVEVEEVTEE